MAATIATTATAQFVSGLRKHTLDSWKVCAPYLIMLGGTGISEMSCVLDKVVPVYKHVFVVPGPEEMIMEEGVICQRMNYTTAPLRHIAAKYANVSVLCRDTFDIGTKTRLVGLPWWPHVPLTPYYNREYVKMLIDMETKGEPHISDSVDMQNRMSSSDRHWLTIAIMNAQTQGKQVIVASHYSPTYAAVPDVLHIKKHLFASSAVGLGPIRSWIYGVGGTGISGMVDTFHTMNNPIETPGFTPFITVPLV